MRWRLAAVWRWGPGSSSLGKMWASSYRVRSTTASAQRARPMAPLGEEEEVVEKLEKRGGDERRRQRVDEPTIEPRERQYLQIPIQKAARVQSAECRVQSTESQKAEAGKRG